jgi:uncharacterized protein
MNESNDSSTPKPAGTEPRALTNEDPLLSTPPSFGEQVRSVLIGPHGLRSGWRLLVYLAMFAALAFLFVFVTGRVFPEARQKSPPVWVGAMGEFCVLMAAIIPAWIMARFEQRSFGDYGLPRRGAFGKQFWVGAVWGLVALSVLLFAIRGAGDFTLGGLALHGTRILKFAAFWGVVFLIVGFFEEFLFRGYTLFTLTQGMGFWPSALLLSAIFGGVHLGNAGEAWIGALAAGMIGLFFCLTLRRTGSLWFAVGMHASWDWAESYLYSVPDSGQVSPGHLLNSSFHGSRWITGGAVGPEGSVFVLILIVLMWVVFERVYPEAKYGV